MHAETLITNLLYTYADAMDSGDFERAATLFEHAQIAMSGEHVVDANGLLASWRKMVRLYPDGTPRTKHVITNPIIEIDDEARSATCQSYYTVLQATDGLALQVVAAGRYRDRFECADGTWRFAFRDYSLLDLRGDLSRHLL